MYTLLKSLRDNNPNYTQLRPFLSNSDRYVRRSTTDSKDLLCNSMDDDDVSLCMVKRSLDHSIVKLLGKPPHPKYFEMFNMF